MSALYLSEYEKEALKAIDIRALEQGIDRALCERRATALYSLRLPSCGPYVAQRLQRFERDLAEYAKSKAAKKRAETRARAWSTGHDLLYVVRDMVQRMEEEEEELHLFRVDDMIPSPHRLSERMEVRVNYQWRRPVDHQWRFGTITFIHNVDTRPDYMLPQPKRKPSAARAEQERQETLYRHWEHFHTLAVHAVRNFLKCGGDGTAIPKTFQTKPAPGDRYLNNFSCDFWRVEASAES